VIKLDETYNKKTVIILRQFHPYLVSLYSNIKNKNYNVIACKNRIELIKNLHKAKIVHLHWIESWFIGYNTKVIFLGTFLRSIWFICFILFIKIFPSKKLVITLHNIQPHRIIYPRFEFLMFKFALTAAHAIIVHNKFSETEIIEKYNINKEKVYIIPHGTFDGYYGNNISRKKARSLLNIPDDRFTILFFGNISKYKGIEQLLQVMPDILDKEKKIFLLVAGSCVDDRLKKIIFDFSLKYPSNSLVKMNRIPDEEVQVFMNAADVGILPYLQVTTSGALLIFMSFRIPVICSDLIPFKELLKDAGIFYTANDANDLKKAILAAFQGKYNLDKLSEEMDNISKESDWATVAERTIEVYDRVLEGST